jgi:DNA-directed RNA polymerase subunit RPC12/RpoP
LKLEELEAIRLKDLEGLEQGECAEKMEVSRPTFQRILISAREKVADSLVHGKAINVEGGNFTRNICPVKCLECGKIWLESFENLESINNGDCACPACGSLQVVCEKVSQGRFCRRNCRRHR